MAWTSLSFAYGSVLTSTKMTQMYDNFAYGAGSTNPTFLTPALGTPASGNLSNCTSNTETVGTGGTQLATCDYVLAAEFVNNDVGVNGIGSMCMMYNNSGSAVASAATVAGSSLNHVNGISNSTIASTGTWRVISGDQVASAESGMFQRIS